MKNRLLAFLGFMLVAATVFSQNVRQSVANGNALNPFIWDCICIPLPGDSIVIKHQVTLDTDFGYTSGAVVITSTGKLIGDNPMRAIAVWGSAILENNGYYNVKRTALFGGRVSNHGTFEADSLFSNVTLNGGFLSTGNVYIEKSFWNTGTFKLTDPSKELVIRNYFYNGDSLISGVNAVLQMEGSMRVNLDFTNADTILGGGQICIDGNSLNLGIITGTLDMCDLSGSNAVDLNLGTIHGTVQVCQSPCLVSINDLVTDTEFSLYPNPSSNHVILSGIDDGFVRIFSADGREIMSFGAQASTQTIDLTAWPSGIYFIHMQRGITMHTARLVVQ